MGFANLYHRLIEGYSRICTPLFNLLKTINPDNPEPITYKKGANKAPIEWTPTCQQVFEELKSRFCSALIFKYFNPTLDTILETDTFDYIVSSILSQRHPDPSTGNSTLHPVTFLFEKMTARECNYGIGDKELLAIIVCLEKWHMYLHGTPFTIYTDHHNLQNLVTKALLNRRQARWAGLMAQYEFQILFRPVKANGKADALTRRFGDLPKERDRRGRPFQAILYHTRFSNFPEPDSDTPATMNSATIMRNSILCQTATQYNTDIRTTLVEDKLAKEIVQALANGTKQYTKVPLGACTVDNNLLYVYGLLYVPDNETLY